MRVFSSSFLDRATLIDMSDFWFVYGVGVGGHVGGRVG